MEQKAIASINKHFSSVTDPRLERRKKHKQMFHEEKENRQVFSQLGD